MRRNESQSPNKRENLIKKKNLIDGIRIGVLLAVLLIIILYQKQLISNSLMVILASTLFIMTLLIDVIYDVLVYAEINRSYKISIFLVIAICVGAIVCYIFELLSVLYVGILLFLGLVINMVFRTFLPSSGYIAEKKSDEVVSFWTNMKMTFHRQRFSTTFLFFVAGILILSTGFLAELNWVYNYLLPGLCILPFLIVLVKEFTEIDFTNFDAKKWLQETGLMTVFIESAILIVLFVVFISGIWNILPTGFQELWEFKSWVIVSYGFSIGITLFVHSLWGLRRIQKNSNTKGFFGNKTDGSEFNSFTYGFAQAIQFAILIFALVWLVRIAKAILSDEFNFSIVMQLIVASIILFSIIESIENRYIQNQFLTQSYETFQLRGIWLYGVIGVGILIGLILYVFVPAFRFIIDIFFVCCAIFGLYIILSPLFNYESPVNEEQPSKPIKTSTDGKHSKSHEHKTMVRAVKVNNGTKFIFDKKN